MCGFIAKILLELAIDEKRVQVQQSCPQSQAAVKLLKYTLRFVRHRYLTLQYVIHIHGKDIYLWIYLI